MADIDGILSDDGRTLTLRSRDDPGRKLTLSTDDVDAAIALLIRTRGEMKPPVPEEFLAEKAYKGVQQPLVAIETDGFGDNILIHLRHPGAGWLHFGVTPEWASIVSEQLKARAEKVKETRATSRKN